MPVPAVTPGGSFTVSSGSMTATHAAMCGVPPTLNLIFRLGSGMTAQSVTPLPELLDGSKSVAEPGRPVVGAEGVVEHGLTKIKRPPGLRPAADTTLLDRDFVVDPAEVDPLVLTYEVGDPIDDNGHDIGRDE